MLSLVSVIVSLQNEKNCVELSLGLVFLAPSIWFLSKLPFIGIVGEGGEQDLESGCKLHSFYCVLLLYDAVAYQKSFYSSMV